MSRLHILEQTAPNVYDVVVHADTPAGNNSAGFSWAAVLVNAGVARSSLKEGTGPGQITTAELAAVTAGTVIEARFQWGDDPAWTGPQRTADLNTRASQAVSAVLADYGARFKWFGQTVT